MLTRLPRPLPRTLFRASVVALLASLAACGGSGGSGGDAPAERPAEDGASAGQTLDGSGPTDAPAPVALGGGGGQPAEPAGTDGPGEAPAGGASPIERGPLPRADVREIDAAYAYRADGAWASVLARCGLAEGYEDSCTLTELPFIAQATATPGVDDVMERVLVTHDWMGARFEEMLRTAPPNLLPLFAATTSITIGSTVRPSFYTPVTGGVRLDPDYLWRTVEEKATVSIDDDPRAPYQALLGFRDVRVGLVGDEPAFEYFPLDDASERTAEQARLPLMWLLYHELAHANDFLPPGDAGLLDPSLRPRDALGSISERWLSPQLQVQYPQYSTLLVRLADVRFGGDEPTATEAALAPDVVGAEFANDGGLDLYSYSTIQEDFAELFMAAMMKASFDVDTHVAFTAQSDTAATCALPVGWGERRRLGDAAVAARAGWAVERILGPDEAPAPAAVLADQTGTAELMEPGVDLCTNLYGPLLARRSRGAGADDLPYEPMPGVERHALAARRHGGLVR